MLRVILVASAFTLAGPAYTHRAVTTAYCQTGRTATGSETAHGTIAVDPRVIPLGTKLYVPGYGWGVARDTGGAVRGWHIDVWFASCAAAIRWGVRSKVLTVAP